MTQALVGALSAFGDQLNFLKQAVERLQYGVQIKKISNVFQAKGDGVWADSGSFLSAAALVETDMSAQQFFKFLIEIENQLDRERAQPLRPPTIDLDLLIFGDTVVRTPQLTLPHPEMHSRIYVLAPCAEVAPDFMHPVLEKSISELKDELTRLHPSWGKFFVSSKEILN